MMIVYGLKIQKSTVFLDKKNDFEGILIDLKCRWLQSGLADLEKHKILPFLLMVDFLRTFKITHFFFRFLTDF